jgi:membrane-bound lytic murein transglycosylase D
MRIKNKITLALLVAISPLYAQETPTNDVATLKQEPKISFLDSIKKTFVKDEIAMCIDSLWMKELTNLDGYNEMISDIKSVNVDEKVDFELPTELLKERLKRLDEKSPFNIEYNIGLENVIKSFLKNRKKGFERLMGISQFYFPIFEEELAKKNIPLEIKYLAVVESALNPKAVSKMGATGLWQFMYQTGKQYGINIDTYIDERSDPIIASKAAAQYMTNMFGIFGDWDLVLASYNSGPGNVAKAIRRSGGQQNYWNIRKNLPKETQGYLPAFLATMYIFEYHKEHGIKPNKAIANHFATDTIGIKKHLTFKQISDLLDISESELQFFNPSYKRNEIPSIAGKINYLRLPKDKIAIFTSNEDKVYAYADYIESKREKPYERLASVRQNDSTNTSYVASDFVSRTKYHKVRRGDNLSEISNKYGVTVAELKKWNGLRSNKAPFGRNLKIVAADKIAYRDKNASVKDTVAKTIESTQIANADSKLDKKFTSEKVVTYKDVTKTYKVKSGDNISEIASKHDVTVADIKKWNKLKSNNILLGSNLKIIKNERVVATVKKEIKTPTLDKTDVIAVNEPKSVKSDKSNVEENNDTSSKHEGYYVVQKGDNLSSIAKSHDVTVQQLKDWNNLMDTNVKLGTQIIISNQPVSDSIDQVAQTKPIEHVVGKGEFLGAIARKYNTTINDLLEWNSLSDTNIKEGEKLIVGKEEIAATTPKSKKAKNSDYALSQKQKDKMYSVQRGDSLFSISKKFPGVTISDIKKWNNIKGESIQPGMKLKISG